MTAEVQAGGLLLAHHGAAGAAGIMLQTGECGSDTILDDYLLHAAERSAARCSRASSKMSEDSEHPLGTAVTMANTSCQQMITVTTFVRGNDVG